MACFHSKRSTTYMVFSLRQLQEKCREQHQPNYIACIYPTKALDLMSRDGLFKILPLIGCPRRLLIVQYDGETSPEFGVKSGVKQGCVLAPTLFGIFFAMLFKRTSREQQKESTSTSELMVSSLTSAV